MTLSQARSIGKRVLARTPLMYRVGQLVFVRVKETLDRLVFLRSHPGAEYVHYSARRMRELHEAGYHSQYGQDFYLWNRVLGRQERGFYVDIGGNDPISLSNSYYLELQGWEGMAFDPLARAEALWRRCRRADFRRAAISAEREERAFVEMVPSQGWEHTLSGFKEYVRDEDLRMYDHNEYLVQAAPLADFLPPGQAVDIVMIDVEGAEEIVVAGTDLRRLRPRYVLVENVSRTGGGEVVRAEILEQGYELIARIGAADDLFARVDAA